MDQIDRLSSLIDEGLIQEVVRPLMSGKEAQVFLVVAGGDYCVAKIYKEANNRTFKQRSEYTEGRHLRNSRDQRAVAKRTRHGRAQDEAAWRSAEVDMLYRLNSAGVRVPTPYNFVDGILLMELITDGNGHPSPQLGALSFDSTSAVQIFEQLLAEVVRMLAAGVVHGDLSEFNVLMDPKGPVIIDLPQAVDAATNQNARKLLVRDVDNLQRFFWRFAPGRKVQPYGQEMWQLYERGELRADTKLSGRFKSAEKAGNVEAVLDLVSDAAYDERQRRQRLGKPMQGLGRGGHAKNANQARNSHPNRPAAPSSEQQRPRAPSQQRTRPNGAGQGSQAGQRSQAGQGSQRGQAGPTGGVHAANDAPAPEKRRRNRRRYRGRS